VSVEQFQPEQLQSKQSQPRNISQKHIKRGR
jgi:hypothetical protein